MGRDPDQVVVMALVAVTEVVTHLVAAVRKTRASSIVTATQETHERNGYHYHVDQWEVGPYTRVQNGKEVRVRGYTAMPRKESHAS
jgi:hypothetical protein